MFVNELYHGGIRALLDYDPTLFDNMVVPEDMDLSEIVDHIIYKYGDTPLFSPDPSVIKYYIGRWSARRLPLWDRYKAAVEMEYNPLENYDRNEKSDNDFTPGAVYESLVSADNSSTYQPNTQSKGSGGKDNTHYESRIHGNIGVVTSQQMLTAELDLNPRLDVIDYIADDFKQEFCLLMYI